MGQQAGGFDNLLLDSLYDDEASRQQSTGAYGGFATNPFDSQDTFAMSHNFAAPPNVQMALIAQQQQQYYLQQQNMMMMPDNYQRHYPHSQAASTNPFADPFAGFTQAAAPLHGSPGLI